ERHGRASPGHPVLTAPCPPKRDARAKPAHDESLMTLTTRQPRTRSTLARRRALVLDGGWLVLTRGLCATPMVFENNVTDRGVRRRHCVEAVDLVDLVVERAAHDQPHHHLDAFGAGLAHVIDMRDLDELLRVFRQIVEKGLVPLAVDQAGARPADLMRQTAGA